MKSKQTAEVGQTYKITHRKWSNDDVDDVCYAVITDRNNQPDGDVELVYHIIHVDPSGQLVSVNRDYSYPEPDFFVDKSAATVELITDPTEIKYVKLLLV